MLLAASVVLLLLLAGLLVLRLRSGRMPMPRRRKRRILPGGDPVPDDLAKDAFTEDQRFLM